MVNVFEQPHAVLYEAADDGERLRVECVVTDEGGLAIMQESEGPLTSFCFEESPHRIETEVPARGVRDLLEYFHLGAVAELPALLRMHYTGYDCARNIRRMMRGIEVPYIVYENVPAR